MADGPTYFAARERDNAEVRTRGLMPLDDAAQLLENQVMDFRNEMNRRGIKEMSPREWFQSFERWLDSSKFEQDYRRDMEMLNG